MSSSWPNFATAVARPSSRRGAAHELQLPLAPVSALGSECLYLARAGAGSAVSQSGFVRAQVLGVLFDVAALRMRAHATLLAEEVQDAFSRLELAQQRACGSSEAACTDAATGSTPPEGEGAAAVAEDSADSTSIESALAELRSLQERMQRARAPGGRGECAAARAQE